MSEHAHDEVVARALQDLPVPDHRPGFWAGLDRAIAAESDADAIAHAAGPAPVADRRLDTGELPSVRSLAHERARRRGRGPWLAVAAALLVLCGAVGIVAVAGGGDGSDGDLAGGADDGQRETLDETTVNEGGGGDQPTSSVAVPETGSVMVAADSPVDVVRQWLDALGDGETEVAASLLGPRSVAYIEALGGDPTGFMQESQEGYGAWSGSPDVEISAGATTPVELLGPGSELAIVTVTGTYPGEGDRRFRVDVIPVVSDQGAWRIETVAHSPARDNRLVFTLPRSTDDGTLGSMGPADDVNVFVPTDGTVFFQIDGGELYADDTSIIGPPEPFALYNPRDDLAPGTHQLVVVAVGADGTITAFGGTFEVGA